MRRTNLGRLAATAAACAATLAIPAAASAGGLYPAGDALNIGAAQMTFNMPGGGSTTCTVDGGSVAIPAAPNNRNATGAYTINYNVNPTITNCSAVFGQPITATVSGTWQLEVNWSNTTGTIFAIKIPANGFKLRNIWNCEVVNTSASSFTGAWYNGWGLTTPRVQSIARVTTGPAIGLSNCGALTPPGPFLTGPATLSTVNASNVNSIIGVGL